ncbi:MAG: 2-polyprenyl-3-methyl-5-hydroxy-6-metoxy-1,4- benzoquinol methylase [Bacteroidetes bacterium HLUCCA01]|nr:MAG: 2-polyprenyl-3-methyl-5-hydroxy-6-metoxy-1,4- benzoquinol methylase [Bacteroidetes bacterium HLUCCA01]
MLDFRTRNTLLRELMDDPDCDPVRLQRTYRQFGTVNRLVASWKRIITRELLLRVAERNGGNRSLTLLDIGCGLLDNAVTVREHAARLGFSLHITGIDPNPVAASMVLARPLPVDAAFEQCYLHDLALQGKHFDLVISNHLMHHLSDEENLALFNDIETVTRGAALMNDLRRSPVSWAAYGLATLPVRWYSFLSIDGMRSIRRSYTPEELMHLTQRCGTAAGTWQVIPVWPFRQVVRYEPHTV